MLFLHNLAEDRLILSEIYALHGNLVYLGQNVALTGGLLVSNLLKVNADHVDVILRPNAQNAAQTIDMTRIWGEEVVIPNVVLIDSGK